ncbi:MAG: cytochrome-c peroxidase [Paracoccaceae bacterium]
MQGLGEGGMGFGAGGTARILNPDIGPKSVDVQPIATPTTLNAAWQSVMLYNGQFGATGPNAGTEYAWADGTPIAVNRLGYEGIETQAIAGLAVHRLLDDKAPNVTAASLLTKNADYADLFARAFPDEPAETRVRQETAGLAIAAYERTLIADRAPFQAWLRGDSAAMTESQKLGASMFFGDGQCVQCHSGPSLAGMQFAGLGLNDLDTAPGAIIKVANFPEILGRGGFTGVEADMFTFKVPQLYNLRDDVAFGHGSSMDSIRAFLDYLNAGIPEPPRVPDTALAPAFHPLGPNEGQLVALTDFIENACMIRTLTAMCLQPCQVVMVFPTMIRSPATIRIHIARNEAQSRKGGAKCRRV